MSANHDPVLVVGGGPVGLMAGLALARLNVPCRVVDASPHAVTESRALAVQSRTLEVAERLGVVDRLIAEGTVGRGGRLALDGREKVHIEFGHIDAPYPFVLMLEQSRTEAILGATLRELGVPFERSVSLTALSQDADGVTATLRHADGREETCRTPYLIGCDGAHSTVRKQLGLTFGGEALPGTFLLADTHVDADWEPDEIRIFGGGEGLFVAFPISGGRWRVIAPVGDEPGLDKRTPTLEEIQAVCDRRVHGGVRLHDPVWLSAFRINSRLVDRLRVGRAFVAGDAAHIHSPAGGQGMNTGMQDVFNLAWKLALVLRGKGSEALLDSYHAERHPNAHALLRATDAATKAITASGPVASTLRASALTLVGKFDFLTDKVAVGMSELTIGYRSSPVVGQARGVPKAGPHPGDRAPDAEGLARVPGQTRRLFAWWGQDLRHQVLIFAGHDPEKGRHAALLDLARDLNTRDPDLINALLIRTGAGVSGDDPVLFDGSRMAHDRYGADDECLYLIRPDGYVGYRSRPADGEALGRHLASVYGG